MTVKIEECGVCSQPIIPWEKIDWDSDFQTMPSGDRLQLHFQLTTTQLSRYPFCKKCAMDFVRSMINSEPRVKLLSLEING
jgi:hypothetical protein